VQPCGLQAYRTSCRHQIKPHYDALGRVCRACHSAGIWIEKEAGSSQFFWKTINIVHGTESFPSFLRRGSRGLWSALNGVAKRQRATKQILVPPSTERTQWMTNSMIALLLLLTLSHHRFIHSHNLHMMLRWQSKGKERLFSCLPTNNNSLHVVPRHVPFMSPPTSLPNWDMAERTRHFNGKSKVVSSRFRPVLKSRSQWLEGKMLTLDGYDMVRVRTALYCTVACCCRNPCCSSEPKVQLHPHEVLIVEPPSTTDIYSRSCTHHLQHGSFPGRPEQWLSIYIHIDS